MPKEFKPFFINSNICMDYSDISTLDAFKKSIVGNIGNSYITYSLIKILFGGLVKINHIQNIYEYDFTKQDNDIDFINNECSHVFLILQDQIRIEESYGLELPYENICNFIKKLNKPVIIAGLGSNFFHGYDKNAHTKLNSRLVKFLKEISEHSELIGLRGYYTQEVLSNLGIDNTKVIGCPSFYEMGRDRIINKKEYSPNLKILLANQLSSFDNKDFNIILQDESALINAIAYGKINYKLLNYQQLDALSKKRFRIFSDIEGWKNFVSNYDFLIGGRVHGSILALNSGTCAIVMNSDTRSKEMSEVLKIPYHPELINETNIQKIYDKCNYDEMNKNYPKLYDNYVTFLNKNGLDIFNKETSLNYDYIKQPQLELYKEDIYSNCVKPSIKIKFLLQNVFSVKNEGKNKLITILGLKINIKRNKK